ncbi:hypothetical protein QFZ46_001969 [Microbacterium murale]|uniref:Uncharacterized protein n=1 Tax=Microbacterium murale TaxID=1081040 RepID=A0ABU0PB23_9MICO|nr:hypothetical protein [Microbacterium murale]
MDLEDLLNELNSGRTITGDSPLHEIMHRTSQDAMRITGELNGGYHEPAEVRALLARLIGKPVDETVTVFPPFSPPTSGATSLSASGSSSTPDASSKTRVASPSATTASSATTS